MNTLRDLCYALRGRHSGRKLQFQTFDLADDVKLWDLAKQGVAMSVGIGIGASALHAQSPRDAATSSCVSPDDSIVEIAAIVVSAARDVSSIWPGYWSMNQPFILAVPHKQALLFSTKDKLPGFVPITLPFGEPGAFYAACGEVEGVSATEGYMDIAIPVGGETATAVHLRKDTRGTIKFLFHEAFHAYQDKHFVASRPLSPRIPTELVTAPDYQAMAQVERRLLAAALVSQQRDSLSTLVLRYLTVRAHRQASVPKHISMYETELERIEGSAEFVARAAAGIAVGDPANSVEQALQHWLLEPLPISSLGGEWTVRVRVYSTGAALAVLLDRLHPAWRMHMEEGRTAPELLREAVHPPPEGFQVSVEHILREHGYDALLQKYTAPPRTP